MKGHVRQAQELLELWDEFKTLGFPDDKWEEFYKEKMTEANTVPGIERERRNYNGNMSNL